MDIEEDDYGFAQPIEISFDEQHIQSDILKSLFEADQELFLQKVHFVASNKQEFSTFKKQVSKLDLILRESFYDSINKKIGEVLQKIQEGKYELKILKETSMLEFLTGLEKLKMNYIEENFEKLRNILCKVDQPEFFIYVFSYLGKLGRNSNKNEELVKDMYDILLQEKQNKMEESPYIIKNKLKNKEIEGEDRILFELKICEFLKKAENLQYRPSDEFLKTKLAILKQKPYHKILDYALENERIHSFCKQIKKDLLSFSFEVKDESIVFIPHEMELHPELQNQATIVKAIKNSDQKILAALNDEMMEIRENKIYCKYTMQMLKSMQYLLKNETQSYHPEIIFSLIEIVKKVTQIPDRVYVTKNKEEKEEYFIVLFHIFAKYFSFHERQRSLNMGELREKLSEDLLMKLLKISEDWLQNRPGKDYTQAFTMDIITILASLFYRRQFQFLTPYQTDVSKMITKILIKMKQFPSKWKKLKRIKAIIDRWGETVPEDCTNFPLILDKFLNTYFTPGVNIKVRNYNIFHPMFASRAFLKFFANEFTKKILQILGNKLTVEDLNNASDEKLTIANEYLFKISLFYSTKIPVQEHDKAADSIYKLYLNYAHSLPILYVFRTWIIQNSNIAKNNLNQNYIVKLISEIKQSMPKVTKLFKGYEPEAFLGQVKSLPSNEGAEVGDFINKVQKLINVLELKAYRQIYSEGIYENVITIARTLSSVMHEIETELILKFNKNPNDHIKELQAKKLSNKKCVLQSFNEIQFNMKMIIRFYVCNISRMMEGKEQVSFVKSFTEIYESLIKTDSNTNNTLSFLLQISGITQLKRQSHLEKHQISRRGQQRHYYENNDKYLMRKEQFVPVNIISVIYSNLRSNFVPLLKNLIQINLSAQKEKTWREGGNSLDSIIQKTKEYESYQKSKSTTLGRNSKILIRNILFPSINVIGQCFYNGKLQPKAKEEYALGILWDQFHTLHTSFTSKEVSALEEQILSFLQICKSKDRKIVQKNQAQRNNPGLRRNRGTEEISRMLVQMGCSQDQIDIALENIEHPDPESVIEWIQLNQQKIQQQIFKKVKERSLLEIGKKKESELEKKEDLLYINYGQFIGNVNKGTKKLIKLLVPQLFSENGNKIKDLIFICLDSFTDQQFKNGKYKDFLQRIVKELDELNKEFDQNKLNIIVGSIDIISTQNNALIPEIHAKQAPLKMLTFIDKANQQTGEKILKVVNKTLPTPTQGSTPNMINYMNYIADILLNSNIKSVHESQILFKLIKAKDENLNKKVLKVVRDSLKKGCIKKKIFSLLSVVLDSDSSFASANIELDIKMFINQNHDLEKSENLVEIDTKRFSRSFFKHEDNPLLNELCRQIFVKRKNKTSLLYDKTKHNLYESQILGCHFLSYNIPSTPKVLIDSLIHLIVEEESVQVQAEYIEQLYKTIQFYKILIPYTLQVKVGGHTFFDWLITKHFPQNKTSISFITFLFVRNGLFYDKTHTFSDYLTATVIHDFITKPEYHENIWILIEILYFMQIKNFNRKSNILFSQEKPESLRSFIEKSMSIKDPIKFIFNSECLYLNYKFELIERLSSKYKINDGGEFTLEKQFLNMDLFYRKNQNQEKSSRDQRSRVLSNLLSGLRIGDEDIEDDEESENLMNLRNYIIQRGAGRGQVYRSSSSNISNIFVPIQPPRNPNQESHQKKEEEKNEEPQKKEEKQQKMVEEEKYEYLMDIINLISEILPKNQQTEMQFQEALLPTIPKQILAAQQFANKNYFVNIKERTELGQNFMKTQIFKERMNQLIKIIDPNGKRPIIQNKTNNKESNLEQPRLRVQESQGGRQLFMLERLMLRQQFEEPRRRDEGNQQVNMTRVLNNVNQYQEPEVPKVQERKEEQKPEEKVEEKPQIQVSQMQQEKQQEKPKEEKQQQKPVQQKQEAKEEQKPKQEQAMEEERPLMQQEKPKEQEKKVQGEMDIEGQQMIRREEDIMVQEPREDQPNEPAHNRQILTMLGLPQTFLNQVGIDEELFDQLPQDMQIQQLNHFISQQNRANNSNNQGGQNNQVPDLASQNAAFIASLDPELRSQTLMEATPQFLATLTPELRAQAQNHRQRFIGRIIEEQQYEEQEMSYDREKHKTNLVYPEVSEELFNDLDSQAAKQLAKGIFLSVPNYRNQVVKILLENKKTQKRMITTLLGTLKNIQSLELIQCNFNSKENQWNHDSLPASGSSKKCFILKGLDMIYENISNSIYKDENFLTGQYNYENFFNLKIQPNSGLLGTQSSYFPAYEFLDMSIDHDHPNLVNEIVKKMTDLPEVLCKKIVRAMKDDKFQPQFYQNLSGLSQNKLLKKYFQSEFSFEKPPKFEILARVLQYEFSRVPYLKKLHIQALKKFSTSKTQLYNFLIQIYRAYSIQDMKEIEQILVENKATHFQLIKFLYDNGKTLEDQPIRIILKLPHLLDFETKRFLFQNHPKLLRQRGRLMIQVNRLNIFQESFNQIMGKTPRQLQGRIKVVFMDQPAEDAGGVKKQWFLCLSRQIFNRQYALFSPSSSGNTFQPNAKSYVNPEHHNYFKFIGRFVAKALAQGMLIDAFFTRSFYKMILGQDLEFQDLAEQDFSIYQSMKWFKENKIEDEELNFTYVSNYFGKLITKELIPDGANVAVTEENKAEYIQKYSLSMMRDAINSQIQKFLEGFYEVLPKQCISFFEAKQLQLLMSGMPTIDLEDLKQNTEYSGYSAGDNIIKWYWEILSQYSNEDLAKLIQFITGTSKIPLEGFSHLEGMNGLQKISIHRDASSHQLPKSHTCFNQLDLPNYPSKEIMKEKLRVVLTWGSEGFGFM